MTRAFKSERHASLSQAFPGEDVEARYKRQRNELMFTTRRYPRTLGEAFPVERTAALHIPRPRPPLFTRSLVITVVALVAACVLIAYR